MEKFDYNNIPADPEFLRAKYMKVSKEIDEHNDEIIRLTKIKNKLFNDYWVLTHA